MSLLSRPLSPGIATFGGSLISAAAAFTINILMARSVGAGGRGEVAWALQASYIAAPMLTMGLERFSLVNPKKTRYGRPGMVWPFTVVATIALATLYPGPMAMIMLMGVVAGYTNIVRSWAIAKGDYGQYAKWLLIYNGWLLAAAAVLYTRGVHSATAWAAIYAVPAIVAFVAERRSSLTPIPVRLSVRFLPGTLNALLASRGERLLLPILSSSRELGLYMAVATSIEILSWAGMGINERAIVDHRDGQRSKSMIAAHALKCLAMYGLASVPIVIATRFVVIPLLGPDFAGAVELIVPLAVATVLWNAYRKMLAPLIATANRLATGLEAGSTIVLVGLGLPLMSIYGALGAAYACTVTYMMALLACVFFLIARLGSDSQRKEKS